MAAESSMEEVCLPEGCISHVLSLTSPRDACRLSATAPSFRSAANSDEVWEGFLPKGYRNLLPRMVRGEDDPPFFNFRTKRELYFRLSNPTLFDGGRLSFVLEKSTGKTCFMLSARTLSIAWWDTPIYWKWISLPDSRFSEVAELKNVCWLDIGGRISTQLLSPKTTYVAYLIFKLRRNHVGFDYSHQEAFITVGENQLPTEAVSVIYHNQDDIEERDDEYTPHSRTDGWMEIVLGEFFNDDGDEGDVLINFREIKKRNWKSGLVVEGIELRPKNQ